MSPTLADNTSEHVMTISVSSQDCIWSTSNYSVLHVGCQSYKHSEWDSHENQPMTGSQTFQLLMKYMIDCFFT